MITLKKTETGWWMVRIGKNNMLSWLKPIWDILFPITCVNCDQGEEFVCLECLNKIKQQDSSRCLWCGKLAVNPGLCVDCQKNFEFDSLISAGFYSDKILERLIHALKFEYIKDLDKPLSEFFVQYVEKSKWQNYFRNAIIIPIPLHERRFNERGFNQGALLAKLIANHFQCEYRDDILNRVKFTDQQAKLDRAGRFDNVKEAFVVNKTDWQPSNLILFDDVITSGATINEATSVLKTAGAKNVLVCSLAHG